MSYRPVGFIEVRVISHCSLERKRVPKKKKKIINKKKGKERKGKEKS